MDSAMLLLLFSLFLHCNIRCQVCKISNVQINNEDGRQQYIELNLKKVDSEEESSCPGCNLSEDSKSGRSNYYSQKIAAPPSFRIALFNGEIVEACELQERSSLPIGLCLNISRKFENGDRKPCRSSVCQLEELEDLAEVIEEGKYLVTSGNSKYRHNIAFGTVLMNLGSNDKAIDIFSAVIQSDPRCHLAYYGRGLAYTRKGLITSNNALKALEDFTQAIKLDESNSRPDFYVQRAQVLMLLQQHNDAHDDITAAITSQPSAKIYFLRGVINLLLENFFEAEQDFRQNLEIDNVEIQTISHFYLGLALYYRGKVRNAVEVFKEVLKDHPDHLEASLSLAHGFKDMGNVRGALNKLQYLIEKDPNHTLAYQLRGSLYYQSGEILKALSDFEKCYSFDSSNANCLYMKGLCRLNLGQFYNGVKDTTKLMIDNMAAIKASPEHIKAHYLREYARYLHSKLDSPVSSMQPDIDFPPHYLDHWINVKKFEFKNYKEQPGLQPQVPDVESSGKISDDLSQLLCRASTLGKLSQVSVDGIVPNKRLNLAMGLAAIHTAQYFELKWKTLKATKISQDKVVVGWRDVFKIGVYYRRLAVLDEPCLWVDSLPDYHTKDGHRADIPFLRGSTTNSKVTPYYELAFKLTKTMLEHYAGDGKPAVKEDISKAESCAALLNVARRRQFNPNGFLVSTQVPSVARQKEEHRLDGGVLVLTEDLSHRVVFTLNIANTPERTAAYGAEMDHLLLQLQEEVKKMNSNRAIDIDSIMSNILSLAYYFYNLIPLSRGSSAVAYSAMLGLLLSVGRQITGRIPNGRLLDMEAMLAGAPDAFVVVAKNWMNIKKNTVPVSSLPKVWEVLPTVRSTLEVLNFNSTLC